jgi:hypothetical protein
MYEIEDLYPMELLLSPELLADVDAALRILGQQYPHLRIGSREAFVRHAIVYAVSNIAEELSRS